MCVFLRGTQGTIPLTREEGMHPKLNVLQTAFPSGVHKWFVASILVWSKYICWKKDESLQFESVLVDLRS